MKTRVITGAYLAFALILLFASRFISNYIFDVVMGVLAVMGIVEIARTLQRLRKNTVVSIVGIYPAILFIGLFISFRFELHWTYYVIYFFSAFVLSILISFIVSLFTKKQNKEEQLKANYKKNNVIYAFQKSLNTGFLLIYPAMLFSSLFVINHLNDFIFVLRNPVINKSTLSLFFLIITFAITIFTDIFAMLIGRLVKGPKMLPIISPNKTYSGAVGGLLGGLLASFTVYFIFMKNATFVTMFNSFAGIGFIVFLGLVGSVVCQLGDIFASYLKRKARVKDYGTIFPGHGGVMDRVDGLIFTSTFVAISALVMLLI